MMQFKDFAELSHSGTESELRTVLTQAAHELDFRRFSLDFVVPKADGSHHFKGLHNVPDGYVSLWSDVARAKTCPVMQHMRRSSMPMVWSRETYEEAGRLEHWEEQSAWGYSTGFAWGCHLPGGRHVLVGMETEREQLEPDDVITEKLARFQLLATCLIDPAIAVLADVAAAEVECPLTPRELEVLKWAYDGKTAGETADLLCITGRTVSLHANTAAHKLGAVNKVQAAIQAVRLGWISGERPLASARSIR